MVRVLFLPEWYPEPGAVRGVSGVFVREHVQACRAYDDVAVLYRASRAAAGGRDFFAYRDAGVPTFAYQYREWPRRGLNWLCGYGPLERAFRRVSALWGRPELLHAQEINAAFFAARLARRYGIPYVISNHWTGFGDRRLNAVNVALARWAYPRAACVLAVNKHSPRYYAAYGMRPRVRWVMNCYDPAIFLPPKEERREALLVHVSGFTEQKCTPEIVAAFARAVERGAPGRLLMIGDGPERAACEALAARLVPAGRIAFPGFLPKPRVADAMRRACALVLPSRFENQPCVLIEALACGTPAITTRVGSIADVLDERHALFVAVGDREGLAGAMTDLLTGRRRFDPAALAADARRRFSAAVVGRAIHEAHVAAVGQG